eukprot:scaffold317413_cov14-Prasinocladus_malaysianus.AAC.1
MEMQEMRWELGVQQRKMRKELYEMQGYISCMRERVQLPATMNGRMCIEVVSSETYISQHRFGKGAVTT